MFSRMRQFLYRHRMKFVIGGAVCGTLAFLSKYAEHKLLEWHNKQTQSLLENQKRRQHYDCTQRTANATVLSLAGSMKEAIDKELDTDALLQAIRDQPEHKRVIWEHLKVVGFSRAVAVVYTSSLVALAMRVQLMLLGGSTYGDVTNDRGESVVSQSLQQKYLAVVHYLLEKGVPKLSQQIMKCVKQIVTGLPLTSSLTLAQVENIFREIKLNLAGENATESCAPACYLEPWGNYVLELPTNPLDNGTKEDQLLYSMMIETADIVNSEDFNTVMDTLTQLGFNHVLDRLADFYPVTKLCNQTNAASENWVDNVNRPESPNIADADTAVDVKPSSQFLNGSTLPVAKLVPVFSGIVHASLSPAPGQLLQKVLIDTKLDAFGANIYEAFALSHGK